MAFPFPDSQVCRRGFWLFSSPIIRELIDKPYPVIFLSASKGQGMNENTTLAQISKPFGYEYR